MAGFSDFFLGKKGGFDRVSNFSPNQQAAQEQIIQQLLQMLQGGNIQGFAPIENQARQQFQQQTIPSIAERFSGLGAQNSSAFSNALGAAGAGLESNIAALKSQYGLQQQGQLQNAAFLPAFESIYRQSQPGFLGNLAGIGLGAGLKGLFGGI